MRQKDEIKLDALSMMDDEIIEKTTQKRNKLMGKKRAPRWILPSSVAAAVIIAIMVPVLLLLLMKQVPIYEGMSVLDNYDGTSTASFEPEKRGNGFEFLSDKKDNNGNNGDNGNHFGQNKKPAGEIIAEDSSIDLDIPEQKMYYATPGQDIYINVHISNPDNFVILSFTLNGKMYSSYMFEDGSDMENLILKVTVPEDAEGIIEYTIDAIKYVDGTDIKDVIMKGERTIKVGVYTDDQPTVALFNENIGTFGYSFDASLNDDRSLISGCGGVVYAMLLDDNSVIEHYKLELGASTHVEFADLKSGTEYRLAVVAYYDSFDGKGYCAHILCEEDVTTGALVAINDLKLENGTLTFRLKTDERFPITVTSIDLVSNDIVVQSIGADVGKFENVVYIGEYFVVANYNHGEDKGRSVSAESVVIDKLSDVSLIIPGGTVYKPFSSFDLLWNASTADWREHHGVDIKVGTDKTVYAAAPGTVTRIEFEDYGWCVRVMLNDGKTTMRYEGLHEYSIEVKVGDVIAGGKVIGQAESQLYEVADPEHLHFSVYEYSTPVDPQKYVYYEVLPLEEYEFMK